MGIARTDLNTAAQVQQGVQLDGRFGRAKRRPVKQAQAQIDGAGIECVYGVVQLDTERVACIVRARRISTVARSNQMCQSRDSLASARVERLTQERKPIA